MLTKNILPTAALFALALTPISSAAGEMWITNEKDHTVTVLDTDKMEVKATYNVGLRPRGITFAKGANALESPFLLQDNTIECIGGLSISAGVSNFGGVSMIGNWPGSAEQGNVYTPQGPGCNAAINATGATCPLIVKVGPRCVSL